MFIYTPLPTHTRQTRRTLTAETGKPMVFLPAAPHLKNLPGSKKPEKKGTSISQKGRYFL